VLQALFEMFPSWPMDLWYTFQVFVGKCISDDGYTILGEHLLLQLCTEWW